MKTTRCQSRSVVSPALKAVALAAAIGAGSVAVAAENGLQRYSPGVGGSDMTAPLVPGWYGQMPIVAYHASKIKNNSGDESSLSGTVPAASLGALGGVLTSGASYSGAKLDYKADTIAMLPRLTYLSTNQLWGGNLGLTVMLPVVYRKLELSSSAPSLSSANMTALTGYFTSVYGNATAGAAAAASASSTIAAGVQSSIAARSGEVFGFGDLEISPIVHWEIGDHQHVTFAPTVIIPTGDYDRYRRVNPGYGNFYTFRPSIQYAFIGDGWDVGARLVFSYNTRNKDTGYRTGNLMNIDYQAMAFVGEDVRLGLQGYVVQQLSRDSQDLSGFSASDVAKLSADVSTGNKMRVYAAGPAITWIKNGGEMMLEGKFLQEFGARNRAEGQAVWLMLSKPL